ncbi:hypothetical protein BV210_00600 [Halorientalis sp. IM1011]|uniref:hypothetical protein n=1 Tax=Halorientalis sp. IM1011 TaxID=1932360 RepID=UPI00097CC3E8|nr:hypothetical protein [Halorientalis sp. IM1011]AQL41302.1 hypothetical protein BV210_00600 [Halorientalis sp. IM1011]
MERNLVDIVWDDLRERVGDDLRTVVQYDARSSAVKFRPDVREQYELDERQQILDDAIVQQLSFSDQETVFKTGELRSFVRVFDEAWVLTWRDPSNVKAGFLISIQRDGDATMEDVEYCIQYLDDEVEPQL